MRTVSYSRHRFPAEVIQHAAWLYFRFPLIIRDVEDLLAQRGIDVSYETVRRWSVKFGLAYANTFRKTQPRADVRWHLDEVFVRISDKCVYLWRAVDCEGVVTLSQIERKLPTTANTEARVFNDLVCRSIAQIWLISLNVTTPGE
jgi:putative transposase